MPYRDVAYGIESTLLSSEPVQFPSGMEASLSYLAAEALLMASPVVSHRRSLELQFQAAELNLRVFLTRILELT
jgi:hypothetical protein